MISQEKIEHYFGDDTGGLSMEDVENVIHLAEHLQPEGLHDRVATAMQALGLVDKYLSLEDQEEAA